MSGICGIVNFDGAPVNPELLERMIAAASYRGAHGHHSWIQDHIGLGHLALYTTPEAVNEHQPLLSQDRRLVLAADARIDNRPELLQVLNAKGYRLTTQSTDPDLIIAAYQEWNEDCAKQLIGDFAFAIWDSAKAALYCARDPFGVRPFHYYLGNRSFYFGSDVSQILADPDVPKDLDGYTIADFLCYNWRDHARSMFSAVQKLLPGHCLSIDLKDSRTPRCWRYWNPDKNAPIHYQSEQEYIDHFRDLFLRVVQDHLRSRNGTVGIMTSGGLDSPSIAAATQYLNRTGKDSTKLAGYLYTYDKFPEVDERKYAQALVDECDLELHYIPYEESVLETLYDPFPGLNMPALDDRCRLTKCVKMMQSRGCDVILRGDGGDGTFSVNTSPYLDDLYSGHWWRLIPWIRASRRQGTSWIHILLGNFVWFFLPSCLRYWIDAVYNRKNFFHVPQWVNPRIRQQIALDKRLYDQSFPRRFHSKVRQSQYELFLDIQLQTPTTTFFDLVAHENNMEARFPFLDQRLMDFMIAIPLDIVVRPGRENSKWLLRQAMAGILPETIRSRPTKTLFTASANYTFFQNKDKLLPQFKDSILSQYGLIDGKILIDEFSAFVTQQHSSHQYIYFSLVSFLENWLRVQIPRITNIQFKELCFWQTE